MTQANYPSHPGTSECLKGTISVLQEHSEALELLRSANPGPELQNYVSHTLTHLNKAIRSLEHAVVRSDLGR